MNITKKRRRPSCEGWAQGELSIIARALQDRLGFIEEMLPERLARSKEPGQRETYVRGWANMRAVLRKVTQLQADLEARHGLREPPPDFFFLEGARDLVPDGMLDDDE